MNKINSYFNRKEYKTPSTVFTRCCTWTSTPMGEYFRYLHERMCTTQTHYDFREETAVILAAMGIPEEQLSEDILSFYDKLEINLYEKVDLESLFVN